MATLPIQFSTTINGSVLVLTISSAAAYGVSVSNFDITLGYSPAIATFASETAGTGYLAAVNGTATSVKLAGIARDGGAGQPPGSTLATLTFTLTGGGTSFPITLSNTALNDDAPVSGSASLVLPVQPITIGGTIGAVQISANATAVPFSAATVLDPNAGAVDTLTVTETTPANGTLSSPSGGTFTAGTGVYTISGSVSVVQAALQGLTFAPTAAGTPGFGGSTVTGLSVNVSDNLGATAVNSSATITVTPATLSIVNNGDGSSFQYAYNPSSTVKATITKYSGPNGTGSIVSLIVNNTDLTSLLFAYNPSSTVTETVSKYSSTDQTNGAPSGTKISDVVDNTDGTSLVYAYNPSSTVTQTTSKFAGTDPVTGAPTGARISDVVANVDGTSLVYAYNPTSTVKQTTTKFSGTDPVNGAPTGNRLSDVIDNVDGTSLVYAYNPVAGVKQTTTSYSGTDPTNGAPTGAQLSAVVANTDGTALVYAYNPTSTVTLTATLFGSTDVANGAPVAGTQRSEVFDYTNGQSAIQVFNADGTTTTTYYSGPDGSGSPISALTPIAALNSVSVVSSSAAVSLDSVPSALAVIDSGKIIDPGPGNATIQFLGGADHDTVVLYPSSVDHLVGFNLSSDVLDFSALLSAAGLSPAGTHPPSSQYLTTATQGADAIVRFDGTGQGGGSTVAVLEGLGSSVTGPTVLLTHGL